MTQCHAVISVFIGMWCFTMTWCLAVRQSSLSYIASLWYIFSLRSLSRYCTAYLTYQAKQTSSWPFIQVQNSWKRVFYAAQLTCSDFLNAVLRHAVDSSMSCKVCQTFTFLSPTLLQIFNVISPAGNSSLPVGMRSRCCHLQWYLEYNNNYYLQAYQPIILARYLLQCPKWILLASCHMVCCVSLLCRHLTMCCPGFRWSKQAYAPFGWRHGQIVEQQQGLASWEAFRIAAVLNMMVFQMHAWYWQMTGVCCWCMHNRAHSLEL